MRTSDRLAALWPFLGIVGIVVVLVTIILIFEKRQKSNKRATATDDDDQDQANDPYAIVNKSIFISFLPLDWYGQQRNPQITTARSVLSKRRYIQQMTPIKKSKGHLRFFLFNRNRI